MSTIEQFVFSLISRDLRLRRSIDLPGVANQVRREFPKVSLYDACETVFRTIVVYRDNREL